MKNPISKKIEECIALVQELKPKDRSPKDRAYAIIKTQLELILAFCEKIENGS